MKYGFSMFNTILETMKEQQGVLMKENKELALENHQLTRRVAEFEQYSRINNVELKGLLSTQGEYCAEILQKIGEKIDCPVAPSDIEVVHRIPAKDGLHILAWFFLRTKKAEFIAKARKARLTAGSIGFTSENASVKPVFINDHLTPENKRLFAQALALKKEKEWQFLWVENCKIKARKTKDSQVYRISGVSDLAVFA